jgi:hypothetical protein
MPFVAGLSFWLSPSYEAPDIHVFLSSGDKDVDGQVKPGHDELRHA